MFLIALLTLTVLANVSFGQFDRSPSEQLAKLIKETEARGFDELMDSISQRDGGNFDIVFARSRFGGNLRRGTSQFQGVLGDPRVRKLYQLALAMPKAEAAARIERAFNEKLKQYQSRGVGGDAQQHGLHAALFLVSEFCDRETFIRSYSDWLKWYRAEVSSEEYKKRFKQDDPVIDHRMAKWAHMEHSAPELLMSASLFLKDQIKQGKTIEEATAHISKVFSESGYKEKLPDVGTVELLPPGDDEAEPLASIPVFAGWGSLGFADDNLHIALLTAIQNQLEPPGIVDKALQMAESAALDRNERREAERRRAELDFKAGTRVTFGGRDVQSRVFKVWAPNKSPDKKEVITALETLLKYKIAQRLQPNWTGPLDEAKQWINAVPEGGTNREQRIRKRWPESENDARRGDTDEAPEPDYWIELEILEASSLSGPPWNEGGDDSEKHKRARSRDCLPLCTGPSGC